MDMKTIPKAIKKPKKPGSKENKSNSELKAIYKKLLKEGEDFDRQIEEYEKKGITSDLKPQMNALHDYNEMKDVAQVVLGFLADAEHVGITELHARYNLPTD